jgi:hypothetical protein
VLRHLKLGRPRHDREDRGMPRLGLERREFLRNHEEILRDVKRRRSKFVDLYDEESPPWPAELIS